MLTRNILPTSPEGLRHHPPRVGGFWFQLEPARRIARSAGPQPAVASEAAGALEAERGR